MIGKMPNNLNESSGNQENNCCQLILYSMFSRCRDSLLFFFFFFCALMRRKCLESEINDNATKPKVKDTPFSGNFFKTFLLILFFVLSSAVRSASMENIFLVSAICSRTWPRNVYLLLL